MKKKRLSLRILAATAAALLVALVLWVGNAFVGNPIGAHIADRAIAEYIDSNYAFLDLEVDGAKYNFKFGSYTAIARSRTNQDIRFMVYSRGGKVEHDDYAGYVQSGFNTLSRLGEEYAAHARALLEASLDIEIQKVQMDYNTERVQNLGDLVRPGMAFSKDLPIPVQMSVHTPIGNPTPAHLGQLFTQIHTVMQQNGCAIGEYSLFYDGSSLLVMVDGVTPTDIESGNLENLLEQASLQPDSGHILLTIRDKAM